MRLRWWRRRRKVDPEAVERARRFMEVAFHDDWDNLEDFLEMKTLAKALSDPDIRIRDLQVPAAFGDALSSGGAEVTEGHMRAAREKLEAPTISEMLDRKDALRRSFGGSEKP